MRFATRAFLWAFLPFAALLAGSFWAVRTAALSAVREALRSSVRDNQITLAREREHNDPDTLAGALDALVHETVRVTVSMLVAVVGVVFVWSRVRVGVTRRAVPMQVALDEFVGSS